MDLLKNWPDRVKQMQANWIGRSEGAEFEFLVVCIDITEKFFVPKISKTFFICRALIRKIFPTLKYSQADQTQYMVHNIWLYQQIIH